MKKIKEIVLIVGASGNLGTQLIKEMSSDFKVYGTYNTRKLNGLLKLDITNPIKVKKFLNSKKYPTS